MGYSSVELFPLVLLGSLETILGKRSSNQKRYPTNGMYYRLLITAERRLILAAKSRQSLGVFRRAGCQHTDRFLKFDLQMFAIANRAPSRTWEARTKLRVANGPVLSGRLCLEHFIALGGHEDGGGGKFS
jgi:hypothetical protein